MKPRLQAWGDSKIVPIAVCLVFDNQGRLLLLKRHADDLGGNKWTTPGGRVDKGETPEMTVGRELFEETGLKNTANEYIGAHKINMPHGSVYMYSFRTTIATKPRIILDPLEHQEYVWLAPQDILGASSIIWGLPSVLRDFKLIDGFSDDPTLNDGSSIKWLD